jgi:hypothetical protein
MKTFLNSCFGILLILLTSIAAHAVDTQPPTAPANLRVTGVTSNSVSLAWNASTDNVKVQRYRVYIGSNTNHYTSTESLNIRVGGLQPARSYSFRLRAADSSGNLSPFTPTVTAVTSRTVSYPVAPTFPLGMFEDGNLVYSSTHYKTMVDDLMSRGFDALMMTNCRSDAHGPYLSYTDTLPFSVYMNPVYDFDRSWWPSQFPATIEQARIAAKPIVDRWKNHPSFKGYYTADEPGMHQEQKLTLISQAFRELDPGHMNFPVLIGIDRVAPLFEASKAGRMVIDVYPCAYRNAIGDFTMNGFGYSHLDFVGYIREATKTRPAGKPLWIILQSHKVGDGSQFWHLREPIASEIRCQNWLAIGEGATGIFWFIYSSEQGWLGLRDNPPLYNEVTSLNQRIRPLRATLRALHRVSNEFTVTGAGPRSHYVSTLLNQDGTRKFIVVVNRDCQSTRTLAINSQQSYRLKNLETGAVINKGTGISLRPGDGRIYEVIP